MKAILDLMIGLCAIGLALYLLIRSIP